jgi:hypothetical protein
MSAAPCLVSREEELAVRVKYDAVDMAVVIGQLLANSDGDSLIFF